jgi:hypothetical protein
MYFRWFPCTSISYYYAPRQTVLYVSSERSKQIAIQYLATLSGKVLTANHLNITAVCEAVAKYVVIKVGFRRMVQPKREPLCSADLEAVRRVQEKKQQIKLATEESCVTPPPHHPLSPK